MKVAVCVHGRFHAFDLAGQLHGRGMLTQIATTYPAFAARRFMPAGIPLRTAPWLELVRRLHGRFGGPSPDHLIATRFAAFAADGLPSDADVFVGWSGASLEAARQARRLGMTVVIERGSTHIAHQDRVLAAAYEGLGMAYTPIDPRIVAREIEEYAIADAIVTGSFPAAATFAGEGVDPAKVAVNPYGVNLERFGRLQPKRGQGRIRILFVGEVGVRKGVPWLLKAFARIKRDAELHLVGPVAPVFKPMLAQLPLDRVHLRGPLRGSALDEEFAAADLFCLPSIEEGFGMVVLEAMAAGLPVVASTATGAADMSAAQPVLIPPADESALAEALALLIADPEGREVRSVAGRQSVANGFSWQDYGDRAVRLYDQLRIER